MGIFKDGVDNCYRDLYQGYLTDAFDPAKSTVDDFKVQKQISLDVARTFAMAGIEAFRRDCQARTNPLFNVLAAYAKHCPEVGYC